MCSTLFGPDVWSRACERVTGTLLLLVVLVYSTPVANADDFTTASARLANQSFELLDELTKESAGASNPLVGPVASFAGDAEGLRKSLVQHDFELASSTVASLQSDRAAVNQALRQHPNAPTARVWTALQQQLEVLAREIPTGSRTANPSVPREEGGSRAAPTRGRPTGGSPIGAVSTDNSAAPQIVVASREPIADGVRIQGYFEGSALKSAGIYEGSKRLRAFKVNDVVGAQKLEFDLHLVNPSAATVLRVTDADNRVAEAPAIDSNLSSAPPMAPATSAEVELNGGTESGDRPVVEGGEDSSAAEIPSHGPIEPSPSKRHTLGGKLGQVQVSILGVTQTRNLPPTYEVVGQISGRGITRAGIYLDGRLAQKIPIISGAAYTSFDQQVVAQSGSMTIRAYGVGSQFVEQSVDVSDAEDPADLSDTSEAGLVSGAPLPAADIAVQISAIRPAGGNLYLVSGTISGSNIASAGLYQNGVLAQRFSLGSGIAGALGALMPGGSRSFSFSSRFNPYAGPATVRAFDTSGAYTEQPLMIAGVSPYGVSAPWPTNPYGGAVVPRYGTPNRNPYRGLPRSVQPLW